MRDYFVLSQNGEGLFNIMSFKTTDIDIAPDDEHKGYKLQFRDIDDDTHFLGSYLTLSHSEQAKKKFLSWVNDGSDDKESVFRIPTDNLLLIHNQQNSEQIYVCKIKNIGIIDLTESCEDLNILPEERFELYAYLNDGSDVSLGNFPDKPKAEEALEKLCVWLSQKNKDSLFPTWFKIPENNAMTQKHKPD